MDLEKEQLKLKLIEAQMGLLQYQHRDVSEAINKATVPPAREPTYSAYELLSACIRSNQLDSKQVDEAMADEVFAAWYAKRFA